MDGIASRGSYTKKLVVWGQIETQSFSAYNANVSVNVLSSSERQFQKQKNEIKQLQSTTIKIKA